MQVNPEAAQRAGIKIGQRLLNLALIVQAGMSNPPEHGERKIVHRQDPGYPEIAKKMSLHGTVKFKILIAPNGSVRRIECIGGHPLLAQFAEEAVKNWKYEPAAGESTQVVDVTF
jgi:TonB family protein